MRSKEQTSTKIPGVLLTVLGLVRLECTYLALTNVSFHKPGPVMSKGIDRVIVSKTTFCTTQNGMRSQVSRI